MKAFIFFGISLCAFLLSGSCNKKVGQQTVSAPVYGSDEALALGERLFIRKCGDCHALHDPKERTGVQWAEVLEVMKYKAELTDSETKLVNDYLFRASTEN